MSSRPEPVVTETRRHRADTIARCERIMETARRLPLTRDALAEAIGRAMPAQLDLMEGWLDAEIESRERSKRARLLKAAGFPNAKDIEGYDWSNLRMPADWGARSSRRSTSSTVARTSCSTGPSAPARPISRSRWAGSRACARYRPGSSPRPGCSCGCAARSARTGSTRSSGRSPGRGSYRSEHALMTR